MDVPVVDVEVDVPVVEVDVEVVVDGVVDVGASELDTKQYFN